MDTTFIKITLYVIGAVVCILGSFTLFSKRNNTIMEECVADGYNRTQCRQIVHNMNYPSYRRDHYDYLLQQKMFDSLADTIVNERKR